MNDKIENIKANDYKFNFKIEGKLNKEITQKEITIKKEFELNEINNKADCTFRIEPNKNADLSCNLKVENYKDIKTFSFKTSQIVTDSNEIYFSKLNDIILMNSEENDQNKTLVIVFVVISVVILAILIAVGIFFINRKLKKAKKKVIKTDKSEKYIIDNKKNISSRNMHALEGMSEERINKLENK